MHLGKKTHVALMIFDNNPISHNQRLCLNIIKVLIMEVKHWFKERPRG